MDLYQSCSVQIKLPDELIQKIQEWSTEMIPEELIYFDENDPTYGRDQRNHITLCIGVDEKQIEDIAEIVKLHLGIELTTKNLKVWEQDKFDVIHLSVEQSSALSEINQNITSMAHKKFARRKFNPHVTIAFMKKGQGTKLINEMKWHQKQSISTLRWNLNELELINRKGVPIPIDIS